MTAENNLTAVLPQWLQQQHNVELAIVERSRAEVITTEDHEARQNQADLVAELQKQKGDIENLTLFCDEARDQIRSQRTKQVIKSLHSDERGTAVAGILNIPEGEAAAAHVEHTITDLSAQTDGVVAAGWVNFGDADEVSENTTVGATNLTQDISNLTAKNGGFTAAGVIRGVDFKTIMNKRYGK